MANYRQLMSTLISVEEDNVTLPTVDTAQLEVEIAQDENKIETAVDVVENSEEVVENLEEQIEVNETLLENAPEQITDEVVATSQEMFAYNLGKLGFSIESVMKRKMSVEAAISPAEKLRVSTEGLKDVATKVKDNIKAFFAKIWNWIKEVANKVKMWISSKWNKNKKTEMFDDLNNIDKALTEEDLKRIFAGTGVEINTKFHELPAILEKKLGMYYLGIDNYDLLKFSKKHTEYINALMSQIDIIFNEVLKRYRNSSYDMNIPVFKDTTFTKELMDSNLKIFDNLEKTGMVCFVVTSAHVFTVTLVGNSLKQRGLEYQAEAALMAKVSVGELVVSVNKNFVDSKLMRQAIDTEFLNLQKQEQFIDKLQNYTKSLENMLKSSSVEAVDMNNMKVLLSYILPATIDTIKDTNNILSLYEYLIKKYNGVVEDAKK